MAVETSPLAVVLFPMVVEAQPLAVVLYPEAKENKPMLAASHWLPSTVPTLNAEREGIHIIRVPAPLTGVVGGFVVLLDKFVNPVGLTDQKPPELVFLISLPAKPVCCQKLVLAAVLGSSVQPPLLLSQ